MTHQEIKELAGHRSVSPWIMKLVCDAVAKEREACAVIAETPISGEQDDITMEAKDRVAKTIRARGEA